MSETDQNTGRDIKDRDEAIAYVQARTVNGRFLIEDKERPGVYTIPAWYPRILIRK